MRKASSAARAKAVAAKKGNSLSPPVDVLLDASAPGYWLPASAAARATAAAVSTFFSTRTVSSRIADCVPETKVRSIFQEPALAEAFV